MTDFSKLPSDITPEAFFSEVQTALANKPAPTNADEERLAVHVGADSFSIGFEAGKLTIKKEAVDAPSLQISSSLEDFRALIAGDIRDILVAKYGSGVTADDLAKLFAISEAKCVNCCWISSNVWAP